MKAFTIQKTYPNEPSYKLFEDFPKSIYTLSDYSVLHQPSIEFLEGCYVVFQNKTPIGRFALYENPNLFLKNEKACCIGSYECVEDEFKSKIVLDFAKNIAKQKKYSWIIGPMEGSKWNSYRFNLTPDYPLFFSEKHHHLYYNEQFLYFGFERIKTYCSNEISLKESGTNSSKKIEAKYTKKGYTVRYINLDDYENELIKIWRLSTEAFSSSFLFTSISQQDFVRNYLPLKNHLCSEMVCLIENENNELEAFMFGTPDLYDSNKEKVILKTIAKRKGSRLDGVGKFFFHKIMETGKQEKFKKLIHAFMEQDNISCAISKELKAKKMKQYALYGLKL